jgi:hypothetical protein
VALTLTSSLIYAYGGLYAIGLGHLFLRRIQDRIWLRVLRHNELPQSAIDLDLRELAGTVGIIERSLYVTSILTHHPEFIGVWLAIKVGGGWKGWSEGRRYPDHVDPKTGQPRAIPGAQVFNAHLIGAGLSLLFAATGAYSIRWLLEGSVLQALTVGTLLVSATFALLLWAWYAPPQSKGSSPSTTKRDLLIGGALASAIIALLLFLLRRGRAA